MIRLSQTIDNVTTSIELPDDADIHEFKECVRKFALAIGYNANTVEEAFEDEA